MPRTPNPGYNEVNKGDVDRSTDGLVVEDTDGSGDDEFSCALRGTCKGYAAEAVFRDSTEYSDVPTAD